MPTAHVTGETEKPKTHNMGIFIGKPFKQLDRASGQWILKTPEPVEFTPKRMEGVPIGSRHGKMMFVLVEKHKGKK